MTAPGYVTKVESASNTSTWHQARGGRQVTMALPYEMTFNDESVVAIISYSIVFVISAIGNLAVLTALCSARDGRRRPTGNGSSIHRTKKRVYRRGFSLLIMHLCVADLVVTFIFIPIEVSWHVTVAWMAGDAACRVLMFARAFGFYLSSFVLVAIAIDRYLSLDPRHGRQAGRRVYTMLTAAWVGSVTASLPQVVVFHVERHPHYVWFTQCVTFNSFPSAAHENAYNVFNFLLIYFMPLLVILITYSLILIRVGSTFWTISRQSVPSKTWTDASYGSTVMSRSGSADRQAVILRRVRINTLKMVLGIVCAFIASWTPYYVISVWWWIHSESASQLDRRLQRCLFIFAVSNSCMDPIIYGMFTTTFRKQAQKWKGCIGFNMS